MYFRIVSFLYLLSLLYAHNGFSQCDARFAKALSPRIANYSIKVLLDDKNKKLQATQTIQFTNHSLVPIRQLRLYMYLNAFKNTETTFLKGTGEIFGQSFLDRTQEEWGWINIDKITRGDIDLSQNMRYVQLDDGNKNDQSVLEVTLDKPILPNETATFDLNWQAQIPKTIARAGFSKDFFFLCHWFPQLGVFEQNRVGAWDWNCHQFFRNNEFYADFGNYDVEITAHNAFVVGASGCLTNSKKHTNGTTTWSYHVEDVIDFAWTAYPYFQVQEDRWKDVQIRLLTPPEHAYMGVRYREALKHALGYLDKHVGAYPYASITVMDPPFHGFRSGLMEYPTLVTVGTFYGIPSGVRLMESLVVHEFTHQYFMQMLASNEKEEPWLDEGFVTYFEDRIIDDQFGAKNSIFDILGIRIGNRELTRIEYTAMRNPREGEPGRPGWMFNDNNFKALIYSKPATTLRTVEQLIGTEKMDDIIRTYFERWKFKHPKGSDFIAVLKEKLGTEQDTVFAKNVTQLFETSIYDTKVLDYAVTKIENEVLPAVTGVFGDPAKLMYQTGNEKPEKVSKVQVSRKGDWVFPVELLVTFEDGTQKTEFWSGEEGVHIFEFSNTAKIVSAQIDPKHKLSLDVDLNNNSMTLQPAASPKWKYAAKVVFWAQNLLQTLSFLS